MSETDMKDAAKQAFKEVITEYVTKFGWLSLKTLGALAVGALLWFAMQSQGWKVP